ncbi:MAG: caspase family protein [Bacteroidia bacterium]|nr:caspase family protein [Bacteroidia bacterium]
MADRKLKWDNPSAEKAYPSRTNHLLAIGINAYEHVGHLGNCVADTQALVSVLTEKYQFEPAQITTLYDHQATRAAILDTLDGLSRRLTARDNLLIYFAGHGYYGEHVKKGYLVPVDGKVESISSLIYNSQIRDYTHGMPVHHLFLVVDSCFSGELILRSAHEQDKTGGEIFAQRVDAFPSRWGLAAGRIEAVSDGLIGDHSPFAKSLITFLEKNPADIFPASELVQHVKKITTYNASQTPVGGVLQNAGDQGGEFVFRKKGVKTVYQPREKETTPKREAETTSLSSAQTQTISAVTSPKPKIYFSYAGETDGTEKGRSAIVDALYQTLEKENFIVIRDKMNLEYGGLISNFMEKIGRGELIVVFISDQFLRSAYCMHELYEIARNNKWEKELFSRRILPVRLEPLKLDDPASLEPYFEYWEQEVVKWHTFIKKRMEKGNVSRAQQERYMMVREISQQFGDLADWLEDIHAMTLPLLSENDFQRVKETILKRVGESP